ncbi:MAG: monovalent cation/H(+) antiporter subunit G [Candidatus Caldatribacteriota bacterium]|nr:monovalent cation/H(+) antiporter subunit G [Candidatus Caldatribacteriota bacterium]
MIAYLFIFLGLVFMFFGTLGIIRFPDIYTRLQTSSKCDAAGAVALLVGLMVREGLNSFSLRILIILIFLLLTNPVATHAIARSAAIRGIKPWLKKKNIKGE